MRKTPGAFLLSFILIGASSLYAVGISRASSASLPAVSFATLSPGLAAQESGGQVTKANWQQHPKIKAVRAIVQSVKTGISRKSLTSRKRAFEYCEPYEDTVRLIVTDSRGRVRFYQNEGGSDDSALKWEHYYDEAGHLRFVFISGGAVNGSQLEHRIYFDERGKRIWEERTFVKGPGYSFPEVWPDDQLQHTGATGKFAAKSPCPEVRQKAAKQKHSH